MSAKNNKPVVVAIGEVVFDILPDCRKLGGAPSDFLHYAGKYGAKSCLVSAIGADDLGREVVSELKKFDIEPVLAITPYPTGRVLIFRNPGNLYSAHILENAAWDYIPYTSAAEDCVRGADAVFFGTLALRKTYSRGTILDLLGQIPEKAYKFFDVNLRQNYYDEELIKELLQKANILKLNNEELKTLKTVLDLKGTAVNVCKTLKNNYNLKYLIYTDSTKESVVYGDDEVTTVTNGRVHQAFAYGAGNAFAGAFVATLLKGASQQEAHNLANQAAIEVCKIGSGDTSVNENKK